MSPADCLSGHDHMRIAARASLSYKTVERAYAGKRITTKTRELIQIAAAQLELPPPPEARGDTP